jgi:pSer/pThr/pTyr-binding forkhead associated (FHA) protein
MDEGKEITLGRAFDNAIHVDDASVSRHHAAIRWKKDSIYITDLNSTNSTTVNAVKAEQGFYYELSEGSEVKIGNVTFKVLNEESLQSADDYSAPAKTVVLDSGNSRRVNKQDFESSI